MQRIIPVFIGFFLLIGNIAISQEVIEKDSLNNGEDYLVGIFDRAQLQKGEFGKYFIKEYTNYEPYDEVLQELKNSIYNKSILIVLATWCHDSKVQVGRFYKILDLLDYNTNNITHYCLDKEKKSGDLDISYLNIERVPTFIFTENKKEVGRIIEIPKVTFEKDMAEIFSK